MRISERELHNFTDLYPERRSLDKFDTVKEFGLQPK